MIQRCLRCSCCPLRTYWLRVVCGIIGLSIAIPAFARLSPLNSKLNLYGVDGVHAGLAFSELSAAVGFPLHRLSGDASEGCAYYANEARLPGVYFMVVDDELVRVDVVRGSSIRTVSGIGLGSTRTQVLQTYGTSIRVEPGEFVGEYLIYTPRDAEDQDFLLVFETDSQGRVGRMRSGYAGPVGWVEGCL